MSASGGEGKGAMASMNDEQTRGALGAAGIGLWHYTASTTAFTFDERSRALHGLAENATSALSWDDFLKCVHPDDQERVRRRFTLTEAEVFRDFEYRCALPDGTIRMLSCSGSLATDTEGEIQGGCGSCMDLGDRKRVHPQPILAQKMEAVGQLTAGIAHNFNNILSAILPNLQLAARHVDNEGEKYLRNAQLATERAAELVAELMVVAGRRDATSEVPLDLDLVAERVVRICKTTFGSWIQLNFDSDADTHVVLGNEGHIEQVLLNILLNARDALETVPISCPRIEIDLESVESSSGTPEQVILRITDNGPGMEEHILARIFEPIYTNKGSGTGLGLATAYAIVSDHGGTITCSSKPKRGAEFEITFPAHAGSAKVVSQAVVSKFVGGSETILVVDDDHLVRRVTSAALQDAGYDVVQAVGGNEALQAQGENDNFDLVLLDMSMPELTGDQVLSAMRDRDPRIKVLVFTGVGDAELHKLDAPLLHKPAGVNELLQAVRQAIDTEVALEAN